MKNAIILVRLSAMLFIWAGVLLLLRNLVLSFDSFNPSYLFHYFRQELLTPLLLLSAGGIIRLRARSIARSLIKDTEESQ